MNHLNLSLVALALIGNFALASGDHNEVNGETPLTPADIRSRLEVTGEIFVMDPSGRVVQNKSGSARAWQPDNKEGRIVSNWGETSNLFGEVEVRTTWDVGNDGVIHVTVEEFKRAERDKTGERQLKDLLKKQDFTIENFAPIIWKSVANPGKNVVLRLTPQLRAEPKVSSATEIPLAGQDAMIFDNQGSMWTQGLSFESGKFVAIGTHKGTIALSYFPFKGATEMGTASGSRIELKPNDKLKITVLSQTAFLPVGMVARVYGEYLPNRATSRLTSTTLHSTNEESQLLSSLSSPISH